MDSLDEQLAKLKLLNSRPLSPRVYSGVSFGSDASAIPGVKVAALASNYQQAPYISISKDLNSVSVNGQSKQISPGGVSPKKVGPIVPPKPQKQIKLPEVPQSMVVKQACEPLYSKRLQSNGGRSISNTDGKLDLAISSCPPMLHRKQPTYATQNNLYSKMNKVTLDNPAILEHQLEALAHHKMQLEKKGLLQQQLKSPTIYGVTANSCVPKLSTASFLTELKHSNSNVLSKAVASGAEPSNVVYSNLCAASRSSPVTSEAATTEIESVNVYSNVTMNEQPQFGYPPGVATDLGRTKSGYRNAIFENEAGIDLPPPPAVLTIATAESAEYLKYQNDDDIPPPSPVSSSYSELRRATDIFSKIPVPVPLQQFNDSNNRPTSDGQAISLHYPNFVENCDDAKGASGTTAIGGQQNYVNMNYNNDYVSYNESPSTQSISQGSLDYYGYGSFSQGSSTYESIYEPINPRPPSQLSSRSNYMMYVQYANDPQTADGTVGSSGHLLSLTAAGSTENTNSSSAPGASSGTGVIYKHHNPKEAEVEALTDFLVHSMDSANDVDSYGVCVKCNERVVGENSGCTAMDKVYHISCFTCSQCQINLQGKPFYALESKPYCEYDYLQTLEKCSVCMKPILERILRATGKPYHPQCFTCVVCGNSLDGIPFTVDATNQNYCIADFHKKFAPRCCVCKQPIMPEPGQEETVRVVALDRSFHFECYKCEDCGLLLSSEAEGRGCYPLDDHVLCKSCNAKRVQMLTNRMTTEL